VQCISEAAQRSKRTSPRDLFSACGSHAPDDDRSNVRTKVLSKVPFNGRADASFPCGSVAICRGQL
jgi:hypothetical protein